jgi:hypothetical protein
MEDQLVAAVERLTGRKVRTFLSGSSTPGESAIEVFVLEPDLGAAEPDVDPARVPEATGSPIRPHRWRATVTESTLSVISRHQAASRFAGSRSLSISSGPMTSLSPASPSRPPALCASSSAVVMSPGSAGSRPGLTIQARRAGASGYRDPCWRVRIASSAARICCLLDARPRASAIAQYARTASSMISSTRSALTAARRRHGFRARVTAAIVAAGAVDHHPRPAGPAAQHTEPR